jgi:hypothetical protein
MTSCRQRLLAFGTALEWSHVPMIGENGTKTNWNPLVVEEDNQLIRMI